MEKFQSGYKSKWFYLRDVAVAVLFFVLGAVSSYIWIHYFVSWSGSLEEPVRLGASGFIDPLLYNLDSRNPSLSINKLKSELNSEINNEVSSGAATNISVYFRDLNTGEWTGVNENDNYNPASMLKVPVMMAYLEEARKNPDILNEEIMYDGSFNSNQSEDIKPTKSIQVGETYTVDDLLKFMIEYSDNNAFTILVKNMGVGPINKVYNDLKIDISTSTLAGSLILSPKDYAPFFRVLYSATYLGKKMSEKALDLLSHSDFPEGITSGVPENIVVAQKFGERNLVEGDLSVSKELHDCGIIYYPASPYFLCVMTRGSDFTKLENVLRDISVATWHYVTSTS